MNFQEMIQVLASIKAAVNLMEVKGKDNAQCVLFVNEQCEALTIDLQNAQRVEEGSHDSSGH